MSAIEEIRNAVRKLEKVAYGGATREYPMIPNGEVGVPARVGEFDPRRQSPHLGGAGVHYKVDPYTGRPYYHNAGARLDPYTGKLYYSDNGVEDPEGFGKWIKRIGLAGSLLTGNLPAAALTIGGTTYVGDRVSGYDNGDALTNGAVTGLSTYGVGKAFQAVPWLYNAAKNSRFIAGRPIADKAMSYLPKLALPTIVGGSFAAGAVPGIVESWEAKKRSDGLEGSWRDYVNEDYNQYVGNHPSDVHMDEGLGRKMDKAIANGWLSDEQAKTISEARRLNSVADRLAYKVPYTREYRNSMLSDVSDPSKIHMITEKRRKAIDDANMQGAVADAGSWHGYVR